MDVLLASVAALVVIVVLKAYVYCQMNYWGSVGYGESPEADWTQISQRRAGTHERER